jgi:dihydroxy-acid dehydratase
LIENGDLITIDSTTNQINHHLTDEMIKERYKKWKVPKNIIDNVEPHSWLSKYRKLVGSSTDGCVL